MADSGEGGGRWRKILPAPGVRLLLLLQFAAGLTVSPLATFLPIYLSGIGYSAVFIAGAFTVQRVAGLASSLAGGTLSDLLSRKQTLAVGQVGLVAGSLVLLSRSPPAVLGLWALYGVGTTLNSLGSQSYLMDSVGLGSLGVLTALSYWGYTLGGSIGNPVAGLLLPRVGYGGLALFLAALGAVALALTATALPPSERQGLPGRGHASARGSARLFGFGDIAGRPVILLLALLRFLPTFCYGMLTVFIPLVLARQGAATTTVALYATISSLCAAGAQLGVGRAADRIGPRMPALLCFLLLSASALGIGLGVGRIWPVIVCGVLAISGAWSLSVLLPPLVALVTEAAERGRVLGFIQLFWNLAMILGSFAGGILFQASTALPFLVGGAAVALAPPLLLLYFRVAPQRPAAE